jgi:excinuclease UvrABC nuclease subunit
MISLAQPASVTTIRLRKWCVYAHLLNGEVVYIGKGSHVRPFDIKSRNSEWRERMSSATALDVAILGWFASERTAFIAETRLIKRHRPALNLNRSDMPP